MPLNALHLCVCVCVRVCVRVCARVCKHICACVRVGVGVRAGVCPFWCRFLSLVAAGAVTGMVESVVPLVRSVRVCVHRGRRGLPCLLSGLPAWAEVRVCMPRKG